MRKKELKLVVTFHTTADAMAMEKACKAEEVPGRLIPVPRVISAGCGLAWAAPLEAVEQIKHVMQEKGIEREELHECMVLIFGLKAECAYSVLNSGAIDMEVKSNHVSKKETRI